MPELAALHAITRSQQAMSIEMSHRISTLFTTTSPFKSMAIQLAMVGFDKMPSAKRGFMQRMLGRTGSLPRLLLSAKEA